jgi:arginase family enzyme
LGGDHSIGMSSVVSSIQKTNDVDNLFVILIDTHADANTMEALITKKYSLSTISRNNGIWRSMVSN